MRSMLGMTLFASLLSLATVVADEGDADLKTRVLKLNQVTGDGPVTGTLLGMLKNPEDTKKLVATAKEILKARKPKEEPLNVTASLLLGRAAISVKDYAAAETFLRLNADQARKLESPGRIVNAYSSLVQALLEGKKFDAADDVFKEFQELEIGDGADRAREALRRRMAIILARQGSVEKAMQFIDKLIADDLASGRNNPLNQELKAQVLREAGKLEESATTYQKVIETIQKNKQLPKDIRDQFVDEMRYKLSGVLVDLKKIDEASKLLQGLLDKEPDNSTYANDLGFIWADHDMKLDEAEKLIRQAIEKDRAARKKLQNLPPDDDKDNPAYLDSLGWVLFKKGKFEEAKKHLKEALEQEDGRHLEIYDHLGDCLLKLDDKKGAIEAWKKGLDSATETRRDKLRKSDVEKKVKDAEK